MRESNGRTFNRRDFLRISALGAGALALSPWRTQLTEDFPDAERLGRICAGKVELKSQPDYDSASVGVLYEDAVVPWLREVVGKWPFRNNQRWIQTPGGYIWSPHVQPVLDNPNTPLADIPLQGEEQGMWVEVTVPWVTAFLVNPPARHRWLQHRIENGIPVRFYYKQILWVDDIKENESGVPLYRVNERYGNAGDIFWARAEAFRPIQDEELSPIRPEVGDKQIVVDINPDRQYLSCFEGNTEVFFCRIASGEGKNSTPLSARSSSGFPIWRKLVSLHMAGGTARGGWDTPGIGWTSLFHGDGVAIHSTFWHNNFGEPESHGCVNAKPEDAKWIFRWSQPHVPYQSGDVTMSGEGGTRVKVKNW